MANSRTAVLIDGTALYFRSREGRTERLDYEALNRELRIKSDLGAPERVRSQQPTAAPMTPFDPALFFTTFDAQNEGQAKFLSFLRTRLAWQIEAQPVWDADPLLRGAPRSEGHNEFIRFDAPISFAIGRLLGRRDRIIIVSDSFGLEQPMLSASDYGGTEVVLAFFGHQLDPRWQPIVKGGGISMKFWDLDESKELLFGRELSKVSANSTLSRLD